VLFNKSSAIDEMASQFQFSLSSGVPLTHSLISRFYLRISSYMYIAEN